MGWISTLFKNFGEKVQPVSVNDENFDEEVLGSDLPVLLDIWTPSCTHCDRLVPVVVGLAKTFKDRLKVAEINGAESPKVMASLGVRGTPTVIYFHDGAEVERVVGFRGSLYHRDFIENELLPSIEQERSGSPPTAPS